MAGPVARPPTWSSRAREAEKPTPSRAASSCRATAVPSPWAPALAGTRSVFWMINFSSTGLPFPSSGGSPGTRTPNLPVR
ncbi:hypothetical protein [Actinophytocola oryzae]|uniref:hypothetical protein n=1 Tax=Actinophytocola oryzae TaxID=502181 RepID=UPI001FB88887|nr:hypothetical protein [Actinophytocola oryzae]